MENPLFCAKEDEEEEGFDTDSFLNLDQLDPPERLDECAPKEEVDEKVLKRRRVIQQSEKMRRDRIGSRFTELHKLIQNSDEGGGKKRCTREEILGDTIEYLKRLKEEVERTKREPVSGESVRQHMGAILSDPISRCPPSQAEMELAYITLHSQYSSGFLSTKHYPSMRAKLWTNWHSLDDLSKKIEKEEFKIFTLLFANSYYHLISCEPERVLSTCKEALDIFSRLEKKPGFVLKNCGLDVKTIFMSEMCYAFLSTGRIDQSVQIQQAIARRIADHDLDSSFFTSYLWYVKYLCGGYNQSELSAFKKVIEQHPFISSFLRIVTGASMAIAGEETKMGLELMESGIESGHVIGGEAFEVSLAPLMFSAWIHLDDKNEALSRIDFVIDKAKRLEVCGRLGLGEMYRTKAELLGATSEDNTKREELLNEAETLLDNALEWAEAKGLKLPLLKTLLSAVRLASKRKDRERLSGLLQRLLELYASILRFAKTNTTSDMREARTLLEEFGLIRV